MNDEQIYALSVLLVAASGRKTPLTMAAAEEMLREIASLPRSPFAPPQSVARIAEIGKEYPWEISLVWHIAVTDLAAHGVVEDALLYVVPPAGVAPTQGGNSNGR